LLKYGFIYLEVVRLEVIKALLSFLSYVFHGLLCLVLLVLSGLATIAGAQTLQPACREATPS